MLLLSAQDDSPSLVEFDKKIAMSDDKPLFVYASIDQGKPAIPVWLDVIYEQLQKN